MDNDAIWKGVATIGIWIGIGAACFVAPDQASEIVVAGGFTTVFMWMFG